METFDQGSIAAGDVIDKTLRQIITAAGDGAVAADSARKNILRPISVDSHRHQQSGINETKSKDRNNFD